MCSGGEIIIGRGWSWMVKAKLWLVAGGRGWWQRNYGWSWVDLGGSSKIMAGLGWSCKVARLSNAHFPLFLCV